MPAQPACVDCVYFHLPESKTGGGSGECRRYAPSPNVSSDPAKWPLCKKSDWCGEFKPAKAA